MSVIRPVSGSTTVDRCLAGPGGVDASDGGVTVTVSCPEGGVAKTHWTKRRRRTAQMESAGAGWGRRPRPIRCRDMVGKRVAATCEAREGVIPRERPITKPRLPPPAAPFGLFRGSYLGFQN